MKWQNSWNQRGCVGSSELDCERIGAPIGWDADIERILSDTLVDSLRSKWGECAYVFHLRGLAALERGDTEGALSYFVSAHSVDSQFWLATWEVACIYGNDDNWHSAAEWCRRMTQAPGARAFAEVWFDAGVCFGKVRSWDEQIDAYRKCLKCFPKYEYATNNLGFALLKANRLEESEQVLRGAMEFAADRPYAIWNLARVLKKQGRYAEAINVLMEHKTASGTVSKPASREMSRLKELLKSPPKAKERGKERTKLLEDEQRRVCEEETDEADEELGEGGLAEAEERVTENKLSTSRQRRKGIPVEKTLEILIEQKILRGDTVFNRRLKMYDEPGSQYGRQFPIPGIGFIDLLAVDVDSGDLVVIELKRDQATREVIGQVSEYVGWVMKHLAGANQRVIPIICLHAADERLRNAAEAVGIEVFEYDLSFR